MRAQLIKRINDIRASYWFIPFCMVVGALCLTQLMTLPLVQSFDEWLYANTWVAATDVEGARALLGIVSGSILGVAGVTFSITIVAVSFASSNFGPRLINNFMSDRGSQYTLGTFLGTFVYCLVILNNVHSSSSDAAQQLVKHEIPQLATLMALPLALSSIGVLIYFIHHIAETINIENIVANIGHRLILRAGENFPSERCPDLPKAEKNETQTDYFLQSNVQRALHTITASSNGYVQAIDLEGLHEIASNHDYLIQVHYAPGDFVGAFDQLMTVWSESPAQSIDEDSLRGCFAVGSERTEHQNTLFLVEQLVEVITRALSPGVNDPNTAISCLNQFKSALCANLHGDDDNHQDIISSNSRLRLPALGFDQLVNAMFDPCRQYVSADTNVSLHTINVLATCAWHARGTKALDVLLAQMQALEKSTRKRAKGTVDAQRVTERYRLALQHINDPSEHPLTGTNAYWENLKGTPSTLAIEARSRSVEQ